MSALNDHVDDYLRLRRALGFKLEREGQILPQLVAFVEASGAVTLTSELAIAWARLPRHVRPRVWARRLSAARRFAGYLKTLDPAAEVPPRGVFDARQPRPAPYLWSRGDIGRLLEATSSLRPPLRAASYEALFALLAVSGMRVGEAIALQRDDVDFIAGLITIREAKFGRPRLVPLHPTTTEELRRYAARRDRLCPRPETNAFFLSPAGTAVVYPTLLNTFVQLTTAIGLRTATERPLIHGLRHTFAVNTLIQWQRSGELGARIPALSTYLGHSTPAGTYWYLSAAPELMQLAASRLDERFGARR